MKQYLLVDATRGKLEPLRVGKNIIGRGILPTIDCVTFTSLESPRSAVSRTHAVIELAENGDAWLGDCGSTNGTFLAVNPGTGIRLEPERLYQLRPGTRIVFGDVEVLFDCAGNSQHDECHRRSTMVLPMPFPPFKSPATSSSRSFSEAPTLNDEAPFVSSLGDAAASSAERHGGSSNNHIKKSLSTVHYDHQTGGSPGGQGESASFSSKDMVSKKRSRSNSAGTIQRYVNDNKSIAKTTTPLSSADTAHLLQRVCFSGMDEETRTRVQKRTRQLRLKVTENILDTDVLIVSSPATRTPKLLIAVGRGIPVVTEDFLKDGEVTELEKFVPSLSHGPYKYTSAALRKVIFRCNKTPILQGLTFNLSGIQSKSRGVVREIISGCGGNIPRRQAKDSVVLTDANLDGLYDAVLRGVSALEVKQVGM